MCLSCGLSNYSGALFHLFTHAFFKGLLFLSAGTVIISVKYDQTIYKLGGINKVLALITILQLFSSMSLIGIPFMSGFYSKELILRCTFNSFLVSDLIVFHIINFGILLTTLYSTKYIICLISVSNQTINTDLYFI